MALKVKHKRRGEYRYVLLFNGLIKIKHKYNERLKNRLWSHIKGATYYPDPISGGYYLLPLNKESAIAVLKFGIENDYRFSRELLVKLDQLSRS